MPLPSPRYRLRTLLIVVAGFALTFAVVAAALKFGRHGLLFLFAFTFYAAGVIAFTLVLLFFVALVDHIDKNDPGLPHWRKRDGKR